MWNGFGIDNVGKKALIRQSLYGGKAAGQDFRNHLRDRMRHLGFKSSLADPDVWMQEAATAKGSEYWEYILIYTDNVLVISDTGEKTLRDGIGKYLCSGRFNSIGNQLTVDSYTFPSSK